MPTEILQHKSRPGLDDAPTTGIAGDVVDRDAALPRTDEAIDVLFLNKAELTTSIAPTISWRLRLACSLYSWS